jgi:hypothetical protein
MRVYALGDIKSKKILDKNKTEGELDKRLGLYTLNCLVQNFL